MAQEYAENQGLPAPPCMQCNGACCRASSGHRFAVMLLPHEPSVPGEAVYESAGVRFRVLPYDPDSGTCPHLSPHGRCLIHDERPTLCRVFNCRSALNEDGSPGEFLRENPHVYELLRPDGPVGREPAA